MSSMKRRIGMLGIRRYGDHCELKTTRTFTQTSVINVVFDFHTVEFSFIYHKVRTKRGTIQSDQGLRYTDENTKIKNFKNYIKFD